MANMAIASPLLLPKATAYELRTPHLVENIRLISHRYLSPEHRGSLGGRIRLLEILPFVGSHGWPILTIRLKQGWRDHSYIDHLRHRRQLFDLDHDHRRYIFQHRLTLVSDRVYTFHLLRWIWILHHRNQRRKCSRQAAVAATRTMQGVRRTMRTKIK